MKLERSKPDTESAVTAAQQPGMPLTFMPASTAAFISSLPGSEMQGVPASVITATLFPESISFMKYEALPCSLNLWFETSLFFTPSIFRRTIDLLVSSAAIISTSFKIRVPLGDMSLELPIGVATI